MSKKVFVNGPGLYWYDGMTMKKVNKPKKVKCERGLHDDFPRIPKICLTKKKFYKFVDEVEEYLTDQAAYYYFKGHDETIDEIFKDVEIDD